MSSVLDQSLDLNGQELHRIISLYGAPDYVKEASSDRLCGGEGMPAHLYADPVQRRYACHTAPAVWASTAFFYEKRAGMDDAAAARVMQKLAECAKHFAIAADVNDLKTKIARAQATDVGTLPDEAFAIVRSYEDGRKERRYPMRNALEVQAACRYMDEHRDQLRYKDRRTLATKIMQKAAEYGADVSHWQTMLDKTSGQGICSSKEAADMVRHRAGILRAGEEDLRDELTKLAAMIDEQGEDFLLFVPREELAETIDQFDHERGLQVGYRQGTLERPEDVLFGVTEKIAMDLSNELLENNRTGNIYKRADLEGVEYGDLVDAMGADFAGAVSTANAWVDLEKLATIVPTLPLQDAQMFDNMLAAVGIRPFATKAAEAREPAFPAAEQEALAAQHKPAPGSLWSQIRR